MMLLTYRWPGNVRELQNVIRAAGIDAGRTIRPEHLARHLDHGEGDPAPKPSLADQVLAVVDRTGSASMVEFRDQTSGPGTTLRRAISEMVAAGVLTRVGHGRHTRYARTDSPDVKPLTARRREIMRRVKDAGRITRFECTQIAKTSIRTAGRDLAQLVERGYLRRDGRAGNATGYVLASRRPVPLACDA